MKRWFALSLVLLPWLAQASPQSNPQAGLLESAFPKPPLLYLELSRGSDFSDAWLHSAAWKELLASPPYQAFLQSEDGQRMEAGLKTAEAFLGRDPVELVIDVFGGRMAFAVWDKQSWALIALPRADVHAEFEKFANLAVLDSKNRRESKDGFDVLVFPTSALVQTGAGLVLASGPGTALSIAHALKPSPASKEARLRFRLDLDALRALKGKTEPIPAPPNPGGLLIAGGWVDILNHSRSFALEGGLEQGGGLRLEGKLDAGTDSIPEATRSLLAPPSSPAPPADSPSQLGSLSLARDFGLFWKQRRTLFPPALLPKLAESENALNAMFSGSAEDAFSALEPRLTLVAAPQSYDKTAPRLKTPGLALVASLTDPETSGQRFLQAFQSGIVLTNMGRAQQQAGTDPLSLDAAPATEGVQLVRARFLARELTDEDQGLRYNLTPACAVRGQRLVLSSAESTARELLNAAPSAAPAARTPASDLLILHGAPIAAALEEALPWLVTQQMLNEGKTREKATSDLRMGILLARSLGTLSAGLEYLPAETRLTLDLR